MKTPSRLFLLTAALGLLSTTVLAEEKKACCAAKPAAEESAEATPLRADSLYQIEVGFTNDRGEPFELADLRGEPVVLTMFFASCGHACPMLERAMHELRAGLPEGAPVPQLVLVSFDVERDTPEALARHREARQLDERWELLHGDDEAVSELAALLSIKYQQDATGGFAHSNVITLLDDEGVMVHQRWGLMGGMDEAQGALNDLVAAPLKK
jgi:protein SCO1/2